jgi:hypothetical protein
MGEPLDELAAIERNLAEAETTNCPVCRLNMSADEATCLRCGADLALLGGVLHSAHSHKQQLYQALLAGDAVDALGHLGTVVQLTGPSVELAVLRRLLRHGAVPVEVLADLAPPDSDDPGPLAVYSLPSDGDVLAPPVDDNERLAFAGLYQLEPADSAAPEPAPEPPEPPALPPAPVTTSGRTAADWLVPLVAVLATLYLGFFAGRQASPPPPTPSAVVAPAKSPAAVKAPVKR